MIEFDDYKQRTLALQPKIEELAQAYNIDKLRTEVEELQQKTASPEFWNDMASSQSVMQKLKTSEDKVKKVDSFRSRAEEIPN